jgi:hypothetical protein
VFRTGEYVQEGDAFRRERIGTATPLATWEVTSTTPERVVGTDLESGAGREWEREALERGLLVGEYSTNLTDFEEISVVQIGRWGDDDGGDEGDAEVGSGYRYDGRPYVTIVAYGDNGRKYARRYRFVDDGGGTLELWTQDPAVERFADEIAARLDGRVRAELAVDGYEVREPTAE